MVFDHHQKATILEHMPPRRYGQVLSRQVEPQRPKKGLRMILSKQRSLFRAGLTSALVFGAAPMPAFADSIPAIHDPRSFEWIEAMNTDSAARAQLHARMKLFLKRTSFDSSMVDAISQSLLLGLLKDEELFNRFLTDDEYTKEIVFQYYHSYNFYRQMKFHLGPISTGITPGTGS
jgi:hypothetical protein